MRAGFPLGGFHHLAHKKAEKLFFALAIGIHFFGVRGQNLLDVRICFGRDLFPKPCGSNEEQRVCRAGTINVPAARPH